MGNYSTKQYLYSYIEKNDIQNVKKIIQQNPTYLHQPLTYDCKSTPLSRAAFKNNTGLLHYFILRGANPNRKDHLGRTPLMIAACRNNIQIVKILIQQYKADPSITSNQNLDVVDYSIICGFYSLSKYLLEKLKYQKLKTPNFYHYWSQKHIVRYVDYQLMIQSLNADKQENEIPNLYIKSQTHFIDPIVDPRESWNDYFNRMAFFGQPPLCQRSQLPQNLQPHKSWRRRFINWFYGYSNQPKINAISEPDFKLKQQKQLEDRCVVSENL